MSPSRLSLEHFRNRLANLDALPQFALLGVLSGIITGFIIVAFRLAIETPLQFWLPDGDPENFEDLTTTIRFLVPLAGALILGLLISNLSKETRGIGVAHVLQRLNLHEGHLSLKNAAVQFFVGIIAMGSGQSAGREGPAIHLGAACNSYIGRRFHLPNNSIRVLIGCGTAAAISASFNTPIAGVIFAMEVVMMEYTVAGFTPVILSAVSAAVITRIFYGADPAFTVPTLTIKSLWDIPFTLLMGLAIGTLAALFIKLVRAMSRFHHYHLMLRALIAGLFTGLVAALVPEVMGVGYDSVNLALTGGLGIGLLITLTAAKLLATAIPLGLGMPLGLIGPIMVAGASAGATLGACGALLAPDYASHAGVYAVLGMGAMMGAVLQAPLAALMAMMELTNNPHIILPGMLTIVVASITVRALFKEPSIFQSVLATQGIFIREAPILQGLRRVGVVSLMNQRFIASERRIDTETAESLLTNDPEWIVLLDDRQPVALLPAVDLARFLESEETTGDEQEDSESIDLLSIPARRRDLCPIHRQATLQEALQTLHKSGIEALYVERVHAPMISSVMGVITREDLENYYLNK